MARVAAHRLRHQQTSVRSIQQPPKFPVVWRSRPGDTTHRHTPPAPSLETRRGKAKAYGALPGLHNGSSMGLCMSSPFSGDMYQPIHHHRSVASDNLVADRPKARPCSAILHSCATHPSWKKLAMRNASSAAQGCTTWLQDQRIIDLTDRAPMNEKHSGKHTAVRNPGEGRWSKAERLRGRETLRKRTLMVGSMQSQ